MLQVAELQERVRKVLVWAKHMETHIVLLFKRDETQQRVLSHGTGKGARPGRHSANFETITAPIFVAFSR